MISRIHILYLTHIIYIDSRKPSSPIPRHNPRSCSEAWSCGNAEISWLNWRFDSSMDLFKIHLSFGRSFRKADTLPLYQASMAKGKSPIGFLVELKHQLLPSTCLWHPQLQWELSTTPVWDRPISHYKYGWEGGSWSSPQGIFAKRKIEVPVYANTSIAFSCIPLRSCQL